MKPAKPVIPLILLSLLHIFLGINGLAGGILLMIKPDGSLLGMQSDWLINAPFNNYLIPGLLLAFFLGVIPLATLSGILKRRKCRLMNLLNIYRNRNWAWSFSLYTGIVAITWITIQLILTRYFWIQPVIIFNGVFIIIVTLLPGVMEHFEINP
jgi:hypothetical protein